MSQSQIEPMELKRRELIQQIYNVRRLLKDVHEMRSWTTEEKDLGFAVRRKVPSIIRKLPTKVWPVI